jgi:hypothetical protein
METAHVGILEIQLVGFFSAYIEDIGLRWLCDELPLLV